MDERILWEKFRKTGRIVDYLIYSQCKNTINTYQDNWLSKVK